MKTIKERLAALERTQWILVVVVLGKAGLEFIPLLIAILL